MKKKWFAGILSFTLLLGLAGCSQSETKKAETNTSLPLEKISIVLDWYPNAVHTFLYEGIEKGYFQEEGLEVEILFPSNSNDAISLTAAGKADIGIYYQQDIILARANEKIPIRAIGTIVQEPISVVTSLKEKNILSPKDLLGKTIGYSGTMSEETTIIEMIKNSGGSIDDVNLINVGFDLMSAMTTGNVDATYGCFINHEIPALEEQGFEVNYFNLTEYGIPTYYSLVFVAGEKNLEQKSDAYTRFLRACQKGFQDMKQNPQEALNLLLENQNTENFPLSEYVEKRSFEILLPMMETENAPFLTQDKSIWQENIDWMEKTGMIQEKINVDDTIFNLIP